MLSSVRSIIMFSSEVVARLRLMKPSSGPRPLTKGGPLRTERGEDAFSFSLSETSGSGQEWAQGRLGGWFSLGSGFRRLKGRRARDRRKYGSFGAAPLCMMKDTILIQYIDEGKSNTESLEVSNRHC